MEEWLHLAKRDTIAVFDAMALVIAAAGTAEAFLTGLWASFLTPATHRRVREV